MKLDVTPVNDKNQPHGYWIVYHTNSNLWYKGNLINGLYSGYWETYSVNGQLTYKEYFIL